MIKTVSSSRWFAQTTRGRYVHVPSYYCRAQLSSVFQIGDLLKDWRRINVSFTRARSKLIIFGSRKTLKTAPLLQEFFALMESRGWILALPPSAHRLHDSLRAQGVLKRSLSEIVSETEEREISRQQKRSKKGEITEEGFLKSRHILKDLVNDGQ